MSFARLISPVRPAVVALLLAACSSSPTTLSDGGPFGTGGIPGDSTVTQVFEASANRDLDLLFMVDNSAFMAAFQARLAVRFSTFISELAKATPGGLPNLHLAVVSSSLGAGAMMPTAQCAVGGDRGEFQTAPRLSNCTTGLAADQHFLSSIDGVKNFTGDIATAFGCIAQLGNQGCGFEHQFASMLRALEPGPDQPAINRGFLRPSAYLGIVLVTNGDDCSAPPDSDLFDTASQSIADPLGPMTPFRCYEFGHLCDGKKPPRTPANLTGCVSAEDGRLLKVADVIARTRALKEDPSKIVVAAIAGHATPYSVTLKPGTTSAGVTEQQPTIAPSCLETDGTYGDPAVRIVQWLDAFKGTFAPICDQTFERALTQIAQSIAGRIGPQCIEGKLVDSDLNHQGVQPNCTVTDITTDKGAITEKPIASCQKSNGVLPCWESTLSDLVCPYEAGKMKTLISVLRPDATHFGLSTRVTCSVCQAGNNSNACSY